MRTIGLIGGMSWESSAEYYRIVNETVKERLGGLHSAQVLLYSVDFAAIEELQHAGEWERAADWAMRAAEQARRGEAAAREQDDGRPRLYRAPPAGRSRPPPRSA